MGSVVCHKNARRILPRDEIYTIRVWDSGQDGAGNYELSLVGKCTRPQEATVLDQWAPVTVRVPANLADAVRYLERFSMFHAGLLKSVPRAGPVLGQEYKELVEELVFGLSGEKEALSP